MSKAYKLAVLDIAGTTVVDKDFVAIAFVEAFMQYGIDLRIEEINPLMGFKKTEAIATVLQRKKIEVTPEKVDFINNIFTNQMIYFYSTSSQVEALPHAEAFFQFLKSKGIAVALDSGFPRVIVEVEKGRPFPFMINRLMALAGVEETAAVIKVGDTMVDIQEGRMSNCGLVAAVTTGAYSRAELMAYSPDHVVDSLAELEQYI
jgi:phosphoglycolate phosphatase-like HAD superfamily hydrolase